MATILEMEHTAGCSEGPRFHAIDPAFDDLFQWQVTDFCALAEIVDIADHSFGSVLDELPELRVDDHIAAAGSPLIPAPSLPSSTPSFPSPSAVTVPSCEHATAAALAAPASALVAAGAAPAATRSNAEPQRVQTASTRPVIAIPSCPEPISPPGSTLTSATSSLGCDVRSQREPSVTTPQSARHEARLPAASKLPKRSRAGEKKAPKEAGARGPAAPKETRFPPQADHIIRERQRRDDMSAKYTTLESLLPPAPKRERAVIVEDTMQFVKNLQHRKEELLKRRAQFTTRAAAAGVSPRRTKRARHETGSPVSSSMDLAAATARDMIAAPAAGPKISVKTLQIHTRSSDELLIEMVSGDARPNLQSRLIQTLESVGLELSRCNLHRLPHGIVHCMITAKPQTTHARAEIQSPPGMVGALRSAFEHT